MPQLDHNHLKRISVILRALVDEDPILAQLAAEDVYVIIDVGRSVGLSMKEILEQHEMIRAQHTKEEKIKSTPPGSLSIN